MPSAERERLLEILADLSRRFFNVCQEISSIAKSVRQKIEASGVEVAEDKLQQQLSRQCKVFEKLEEITAQVAEKFGCTTDEIQEMQTRMAKDSLVATYTEGFQTMLSDALSGMPPVLPNFKVPAGLTEEKVLQIQGEAQILEAKKVKEKVGRSKLVWSQLGEVLTVVHKDAWAETFETHAQTIEGSPEIFHSAVATYMRNEDFARDKNKLHEQHQQKMVKLFQPSDGAKDKNAKDKKVADGAKGKS